MKKKKIADSSASIEAIPMLAEGKLSFKEWIAKNENTTIEWANQLVNDLVNVPTHLGDCTKDIHTCSLCLLETLLNEYYEYLKSGGFVAFR